MPEFDLNFLQAGAGSSVSFTRLGTSANGGTVVSGGSFIMLSNTNIKVEEPQWDEEPVFPLSFTDN